MLALSQPYLAAPALPSTRPGGPPLPPAPTGTIVTTLPLAVSTRSLRAPLRQALVAAARLGADGVEIDARREIRVEEFSQTAVRQFRKSLEDHGLRLAALSFPTRNPLWEELGLERRLEALRGAMGLAHRLGAAVLVHPMPDLPMPDLPEAGGDETAAGPPPAWRNLVEVVAALGAYGDRVGARLALATGAAPDAQARLLAELPEGAASVALHAGALVGRGHVAAEAAAVLGAHVAYVIAADAVCEGAATGLRGVEVELGRGQADLPEVLSRLEEHGYRGWVAAERLEGEDPAGDLASALALLRAE